MFEWSHGHLSFKKWLTLETAPFKGSETIGQHVCDSSERRLGSWLLWRNSFKITDRFPSWYRCFYAFDVAACRNSHTHTSKCERFKASCPVWEDNCATLCIWTLCQRKIPADEERYSDWEGRHNISDFLTGASLLIWVTDYIDGFGHSRRDLELPLLKSNSSCACEEKASMDEGNIYAHNEPHMASLHPSKHIHAYITKIQFSDS